MSRAPGHFTQADVTRALKGAARAGVLVRIVIHSTGVMVIEPVDGANAESHPMPKEGSGWGNEGHQVAVRPRIYG